MNTIPIFYNDKGFLELNNFLEEISFSKLIIIVDQHTKTFCLPKLEKYFKHPFSFIEVKNGEQYKTLETSEKLWNDLLNIGADRQSIVLNLGGGVVTDIGGFVAATYKRGIRFINIPTTVLSMVDAAIGGKTGVDFKGLKNQIGVFQNAIALLININFLDTLDKREIASGLAEIIKYGLIDSPSLLDEIKELNPKELRISSSIIKQSAAIKMKIVAKDPTEQNLRKTLNFGHTLGHAVETFFMNKPKKERLLHGEAVAIGMIMALHLSYQTKGLSIDIVENTSKLIQYFYTEDFETIQNEIKQKTKLPFIHDEAISEILALLEHDKKNVNGQLNFVLLEDLGEAVIDCKANTSEIIQAINYYNDIIL